MNKIPSEKMSGGFTLIELLVVVIIMGVVLSFGFANFRDFQKRQVYIQAAQELEGILETVRGRAVSGTYAGDCPAPYEDNTVNGVFMKINQVPGSLPWNYEVFVSCVDEEGVIVTNDNNPSDPVDSGTFETEVRFEHNGAGVGFSVLDGSLYNLPGNPDNCISITNNQLISGGYSVDVCVTDLGTIYTVQ